MGRAAAQPLRWDDGVLRVLDQTLLPREERWVECRSAADVADAISRLAVRGAPAIGIAAAYALALEARAGRDVAAAHALLGATRPTAVNLHWALDRGLAAHEQGRDLVELAHAIAADQAAADHAMGELGARLFDEGDRVLTHCNTGPLATGGRGTAGAVLRSAWETGRLAQVWVDETRPLLQGARLTAWELQREGIPFRIVPDGSVGALMARGVVDRVVVGADRIARNGDTANKIGTYTVAALAARHAVPFYVAAPLSTIDPDTASGAEIPIEERDPAEVTSLFDAQVAPAGADAMNLAFDVTPAELITAIVTEVAVLEPPYPEAIARALRRDGEPARP